MRALAVLLAVLAFGCSNRVPGEDESSIPPAPVGPGEFDAQRWLEEARASVVSLEAAAPGDAATDRMKALAEELNAEVDWRRACDTYLDHETGEETYEPIEPELSSWVRGTMEIGDVSVTEAVVAVTCDFGAYQGNYALVHVDRNGVRLLSAPAVAYGGRILPARQTTFSTPVFDEIGQRELSTYGRARGLGDCGVYSTYALSGDESLELLEVRSRDCGDEIPDPLPPPSEWPVVYSAN